MAMVRIMLSASSAALIVRVLLLRRVKIRPRQKRGSERDKVHFIIESAEGERGMYSANISVEEFERGNAEMASRVFSRAMDLIKEGDKHRGDTRECCRPNHERETHL